MKSATFHRFATLLAATAFTTVLGRAAFAQELPPAGTLALETAKEYRHAARYPNHSTVIAKGGIDPIREKRTPNVVTSGRAQDGPTLTLMSRKISYEYPSQVDFFATVTGGQPLVISGEVTREDGGKAGVVRFFDDGVGIDAAAGDGIWSGRVEFTERRRPALADSYLVKVDATFGNGETKTGVSGFLYSQPHARLTGRYRDTVQNGSLVVEAQVEVSQAGRFHLAGTLATLDGSPVGTAQAAQRLEPGKHWIRLEFYGLMFHERGAEGRFRLASLALATTTSMPNAWNDLVENAYTTRPISLGAMTSQGFGRPELLDSANRLEAEGAAALLGSKN